MALTGNGGWDSSVSTRITELLLLAASIRTQIVNATPSVLTRDCAQRLSKVVRGEESLLHRMYERREEPTAARLASSNLHHISALLAALHHPHITSTSQVLHTISSSTERPSHKSHASPDVEPSDTSSADSYLLPDGNRVSKQSRGGWVGIDSNDSCQRAADSCSGTAMSSGRDASCSDEGPDEVAGSEATSCHVGAVCFLDHRLTWLVVGARKRYSHSLEDGGGTAGLQTHVRKLLGAARGVGGWEGVRELPERLALFFLNGLGEEVVAKLKAEFGAAYREGEGEKGCWLVIEVRELTTSGPGMRESLEGVNLDTTALVALVSELSNGAAPSVLQMSREALVGRYHGMAGFVRLQAQSEMENPLILEIERQLKGKQAIVCHLAHSEFTSIVEKIGGVKEKARAQALLLCVRIVADKPSRRISSLQVTGRIQMRHINVIGTGDMLGIPTLSANTSFMRAATKAGLSLNIIPHRPRALLGE